MGGKNRFAKELLPIILKDRVDGQYYVEPFAGGSKVSTEKLFTIKDKYSSIKLGGGM